VSEPKVFARFDEAECPFCHFVHTHGRDLEDMAFDCEFTCDRCHENFAVRVDRVFSTARTGADIGISFDEKTKVESHDDISAHVKLVAVAPESDLSGFKANQGIFGLAPGPWDFNDLYASFSYPTDGYDGRLGALDNEHEGDFSGLVERSGHTREEWLRLANAMIVRWADWRAALIARFPEETRRE
jgi:hypothetical protein